MSCWTLILSSGIQVSHFYIEYVSRYLASICATSMKIVEEVKASRLSMPPDCCSCGKRHKQWYVLCNELLGQIVFLRQLNLTIIALPYSDVTITTTIFDEISYLKQMCLYY